MQETIFRSAGDCLFWRRNAGTGGTSLATCQFDIFAGQGCREPLAEGRVAVEKRMEPDAGNELGGKVLLEVLEREGRDDDDE